MKKTIFLSIFAMLLFSVAMQAQNSIKFRIKNGGFTVPGSFSSFKPYVTYDKANPSSSKFSCTVDISSINTNNSGRDKHLKNKDFFDAEKYPTMKFESTSVAVVSASKINITGNLTIKDVTKKVTFETAVSEKGGKTIFSSTLLLNRINYNVGEASWTLANDLNIDLNIEK